MASMNNWLGFSLSPQEHPHHHHHHHHHHQDHHSQISGTDDGSGAECFDLSSDSTLPSLNLPPPFGILEAFNNANNQSQDWSMNSENSYKNTTTTSDFSMLMGCTSTSSCTTSATHHHQDHLEGGGPKLENFLGNYMYTTPQLPSDAPVTSATNGGGGGGGGNNTIGLSMIKNWLRNQPTPTTAAQQENNPVNGGAQSLSLSMSTESPTQTSSPLPLLAAAASGGEGSESTSSENNKQQQKGGSNILDAQTGAVVEAVPRKSIDTFGQRTSIYRGVTRHRWTGRYEAHLWDNSCRREGQTRKGRQVYLGGYDKEDKAARAYDLAALKYWGTTTTTNFPISNYEKEIEEMKHMTRQEYVASLRRKSSGFSRGASIYRGVTRHHQHGRWQARIGRVAGNKDLYLGTFSTQEEAAEAYDIAAIKFRGLNAVTNFDMTRYDVKSILESSTLPIGGAAKRLKDAEQSEILAMETVQRAEQENMSAAASHLTNGITGYDSSSTHHHGWPTIAFQQAQPFSMHYPAGYGQQAQRLLWCKQEQDTDNQYPTAAHGFQDLNQLQLGYKHNNFYHQHQPQAVLHNLMSLDSATMEHSSGSNYSGGGGDGIHQGVEYGGGGGGFMMPMAAVIPQEGCNNYGENEMNMFGSSADPYHARNLYYLSQQQSSAGAGGVKAAGVYDQSSTCNGTWVPTAVPTLAARAASMAVCHGAQTFTGWNDA